MEYSPNIQNIALTVGLTKTSITTAKSNIGTIRIRNNSTGIVFIGDSAVETTTGYPVKAGESIDYENVNIGNIWFIADTASQDVRVTILW